jgi:hypothetical protein
MARIYLCLIPELCPAWNNIRWNQGKRSLYCNIYFPKNVWTLKGITALIDLMQTKDFMLKNYFGKLLFPRLHPSQYNQRFKIVAATISLGLIAAGGMITVMILRGAVGQ